MTASRSALIVATSLYRDGRLGTLEAPGRDAEALRNVLADREIGGFEVRVALNSRVQTLRTTLESFFSNRARDDLLLVHFSGHGLKDDDGQLYLAATDTQIDLLKSTGVDAAWVNSLINGCRSERIALFLDCCFAGAFTTAMARRAGADRAGVKERFSGSGVFVIAASDAMQYSFEGGRQVGVPPEPSPFTKALADGLRTGEADRNEDGYVSINELFDFLEDRVRQTSPSQTPTKSSLNQVGDWVIARSTRVPSVRLLPEDVQAQLKSEDALDRFGALIGLRSLIEGPDRRVAEAAMQALQTLTQDDSRRVAAAAQRLVEEEAGRPKPIARTARPRAAPRPVAPETGVDMAAVDAPVIIPEPDVTPGTTAPAAPQSPVPDEAVSGDVLNAVTHAEANPVTPAAIDGSAASDSAGPTWSLYRAAGRAAIGSVVMVLLQVGWLLAINASKVTEQVLGEVAPITLQLSLLVAIPVTVIVALVERQVPAVRLPGGAAWRVVRGNRWLASAIVGAVAGLVVGLPVELAFVPKGVYSPGLDVLVFAVLGFVAAEAVVGRRIRPRPDEPSRPGR